MTWADELERESALTRPGPGCGVAAFLERIADEDERDVVVDILGRVRTIKTSVIERKFAERYDELNPPRAQAIQKHRKGICTCARRS